MKKIIISLILSILTIAAFGQESQNESFYFKAGASFPLYDLASGNLADSSAGMAASGLHVEIGYNYLFTDHFGMGLAAVYFGNKYSHSKFTKFYKGWLADAFIGLKSATAWSVGGLVLKPTYYLRIKKNLSFDVYASGGFFTYYTPDVIITSKSFFSTSTTTFHQNKSKGISLAYGLGSRLNFMFLHTHFFLDADFMTSKLKYDATGTNGDVSFNNPIRQKIGYFSINLGYTIFL